MHGTYTRPRGTLRAPTCRRPLCRRGQRPTMWERVLQTTCVAPQLEEHKHAHMARPGPAKHVSGVLCQSWGAESTGIDARRIDSVASKSEQGPMRHQADADRLVNKLTSAAATGFDKAASAFVCLFCLLLAPRFLFLLCPCFFRATTGPFRSIPTRLEP